MNQAATTGYGLVSDSVLGIDGQYALPFQVSGAGSEPVLFGEGRNRSDEAAAKMQQGLYLREVGGCARQANFPNVKRMTLAIRAEREAVDEHTFEIIFVGELLQIARQRYVVELGAGTAVDHAFTGVRVPARLQRWSRFADDFESPQQPGCAIAHRLPAGHDQPKMGCQSLRTRIFTRVWAS